jgi:hypothetical protein
MEEGRGKKFVLSQLDFRVPRSGQEGRFHEEKENAICDRLIQHSITSQQTTLFSIIAVRTPIPYLPYK